MNIILGDTYLGDTVLIEEEIPPSIPSNSNGGIEVGGNSVGSITFEVSKEFPFSSGQCVEYWWQVVGKCVSTTLITDCPTPGVKSCPRQMLINIMGCSLVDVCNKIAARGYNIEIAQVYQYTLPALISQQNGECGEYVEVSGLPQNCFPYESFTDPEDWKMDFEVEWVGGDGGLKLSGEEVSYQIQGVGGVQLFGDGLSSEDLGLFDVPMEIDAEIGIIEPTFGNTIFPGGLTTTQDIISTSCNCGVIPVDIMLTHNLNNSDKLNSFLARNNLTLPTNFELTYNTSNYAWQANYHFKGYGDDGISLEIWDMVFEWECTDMIGSFVTNQSWAFGFYAKTRNLRTNENYDTRILLAFDPSDVCSGNGLFYNFNLNTVTKAATSANNQLSIDIDLNTCYDNIGLFASNTWLSNPILSIDVWQSGVPTQQKYLDISPLIPQ